MKHGVTQTRFAALVLACSADLYHFAYWLIRNRPEAEDLVQETFARAWRSIRQLRGEMAAKEWLFTTLRREYARQFEAGAISGARHPVCR
jgi:RNA polymerase sigma-70 factor (ECF subfamily)